MFVPNPDGSHADLPRSDDVFHRVVADKPALGSLDFKFATRGVEDRGIGLLEADHTGNHDAVDMGPEAEVVELTVLSVTLTVSDHFDVQDV